MITLVDYGVGNPAAIVNMLRHVGAKCQLTGDPALIAAAEKLILPGVGHFDHCYNELVNRGVLDELTDAVLRRGVPLLGICVGAQLLGHGSEEGVAPGLGWLDLDVARLPVTEGLRLPRMGWGEVAPARPSPLFDSGATFLPRYYFAHSYYLRPTEEGLVAGRTSHGIEYAAAVHRDNIAAVQFHPEKSHHYGMDVLRRFAEWSP